MIRYFIGMQLIMPAMLCYDRNCRVEWWVPLTGLSKLQSCITATRRSAAAKLIEFVLRNPFQKHHHRSGQDVWMFDNHRNSHDSSKIATTS